MNQRKLKKEASRKGMTVEDLIEQRKKQINETRLAKQKRDEIIKTEEQQNKEILIVKKDEERLYLLTKAITENFDSLLDGTDPLILNGMERRGLKKLPHTPSATRAFNRYIKMIEVFRGNRGNQSEEQYLELLIDNWEKNNDSIKESLLNGWKVVDPENEAYTKYPDITTEAVKKIIDARLNKIHNKNFLDDDDIDVSEDDRG